MTRNAMNVTGNENRIIRAMCSPVGWLTAHVASGASVLFASYEKVALRATGSFDLTHRAIKMH